MRRNNSLIVSDERRNLLQPHSEEPVAITG